jgi:hypothetical protein
MRRRIVFGYCSKVVLFYGLVSLHVYLSALLFWLRENVSAGSLRLGLGLGLEVT